MPSPWLIEADTEFLNHGSFGSCPEPVLAVQRALREQLEREPVRFFVRDTIEERILALQERKKLVFDSTVGQDNAAVTQLTPEDMRYLFSH